MKELKRQKSVHYFGDIVVITERVRCDYYGSPCYEVTVIYKYFLHTYKVKSYLSDSQVAQNLVNELAGEGVLVLD